MNLKDILNGTEIINILGNYEIDISGISYDSRNVKSGDLFVCLPGYAFDGHDFIQSAVKNGAVAVAVEKNIKIDGIATIQVKNTRAFLAKSSAKFFNNPAQKLIKIGITGTKGKTTTSFMIKSILESANIKTGLIGTIGTVIGEEIFKLNNTTPESYEIQKYMQKMVENNCKCVVMEASSIGLKSHRLDGFDFDYGIFTNFSHDHIGANEHKDMQEYLECKSKLFQKCKVGFFNIDDNSYSKIIENHSCTLKTYSAGGKNADYNSKNIQLVNTGADVGISFDFYKNDDFKNFYINIPGKFNVYNALAAISVCSFMGVSLEDIQKGLKSVKVKGRVENVKISDDFALFIDYAHNALSMENVLRTFKEYNPKRLITLFGAGGNRPKIRRYEMGEICGKYSDLSVITSDNPRFEDPLEIIEDIKIGINKTNGKYIVIPERREAIKYCIENAQKGDIIILAGKGHEDYQEINGVKYAFDERKIIRGILENKF